MPATVAWHVSDRPAARVVVGWGANLPLLEKWKIKQKQFKQEPSELNGTFQKFWKPNLGTLEYGVIFAPSSF